MHLIISENSSYVTLISAIGINHTERELTFSIVQTAYILYNTIRELTLIMSCLT